MAEDGTVVDVTETNHTRPCITRFESFLDKPTLKSFRALWSSEILADYWKLTAGVLLGQDEEVDQLHVLFSEMEWADEFDPA